jgi:hypothetical protein
MDISFEYIISDTFGNFSDLYLSQVRKIFFLPPRYKDTEKCIYNPLNMI